MLNNSGNAFLINWARIKLQVTELELDECIDLYGHKNVEFAKLEK